MIKRSDLVTLATLLIFLVSTTVALSQNNKQKELEIRRQELRREIQKITELRSENKSK
jgi:energy-converting hydrogenase Eha subunit H